MMQPTKMQAKRRELQPVSREAGKKSERHGALKMKWNEERVGRKSCARLFFFSSCSPQRIAGQISRKVAFCCSSGSIIYILHCDKAFQVHFQLDAWMCCAVYTFFGSRIADKAAEENNTTGCLIIYARRISPLVYFDTSRLFLAQQEYAPKKRERYGT
jgi:hypothetical protein